MHKGIIASLVISVLLVIFALNNSDPVQVNLWWISTFEVSLALLIVIMLVAGVVIGYLLLLPAVFRKGKEVRNKDSEIKKLKAQLSQRESTAGAGQLKTNEQ